MCNLKENMKENIFNGVMATGKLIRTLLMCDDTRRKVLHDIKYKYQESYEKHAEFKPNLREKASKDPVVFGGSTFAGYFSTGPRRSEKC